MFKVYEDALKCYSTCQRKIHKRYDFPQTKTCSNFMLSVMKLNKEIDRLKKNNEIIQTTNPMNFFKAKDDKNVCKEKEVATKNCVP